VSTVVSAELAALKARKDALVARWAVTHVQPLAELAEHAALSRVIARLEAVEQTVKEDE